MLRTVVTAAALVLVASGAWAQGAAPGRPPITGISHIAVYSADFAASDQFYVGKLGAHRTTDPENPSGVRYELSSRQFVEVLPLPAGQGLSRLAHVAYATPDAPKLLAYLTARGVAGLTPIATGANGDQWFDARDPEGNDVQFVQSAAPDAQPWPTAISGRIIHVGFLVRSRAAEDGFYRDILGFRPYWRGAMRPDATDWVSQQVPDGHDWLEYMMVGDGSTTPLTHIDAREMGVLDHFSIGVKNMEAAVTTLIAGDRLSPRHDGPNMGMDGKWQANLYDPDGTRVELMEFQPVTRPCCSAFAADSPTE